MPKLTQDLLSQRIADRFKVAPAVATEMAEVAHPHKDALYANSVFQSWNKAQATRIAGHLWSLSKTYGESGDKGRARVFSRASSSLYEAIKYDNADVCSFEGVKSLPYVGDRIRLEIVHFWVGAITGSFTPRQESLKSHATRPLPQPSWSDED